MTAQSLLDQIIWWMILIIRVVLLALIAAVVLKYIGVNIPLRTLGAQELAYIAIAFWATR